LTPEEDSRRRQRWVLLYAIPFVLIPVGLGTWVHGYKIDDILRNANQRLIETGQIILGVGVAWLLILFARGWIISLKKVIWEWRNPPQDTGIHWTKQGRSQRRRRRRRHSSPSAPSAPVAEGGQ